MATHMAVALHRAGNTILEIYSRSLTNALTLASLVDAKATDNIDHIDSTADLYLFSLKDDILPELVGRMPPTDGIWAHTAGSIPIELFSQFRSRGYGVIYPLQTFSKSRELIFSEIPLLVEGDSEETDKILKKVAETISADVRFLAGDKRLYLHLAAVFANNFSNHMFALASEIVGSRQIPFDLLKPLIAETAAKVMELDPCDAQTGPALRYDEMVIQKHINLLDDPLLKEIYSILSSSINRLSKQC